MKARRTILPTFLKLVWRCYHAGGTVFNHFKSMCFSDGLIYKTITETVFCTFYLANVLSKIVGLNSMMVVTFTGFLSILLTYVDSEGYEIP